MANELKVFSNEEFGSVRVVEINGEGWLVGKDVAEGLGYSNASKAIISHVDEEDKMFQMIETESQNGNVSKTKTACINESGLYSLVLGSKLPSAKKFKRWVTSEVLPTIRSICKTLETIEFRGSIDGLVYSRNSKPMTTSRNIAVVFEKEHREILRLIDNKIKTTNDTLVQFYTDHISKINYIDTWGRTQREYELTEEGFSFIALGLTGEKADIFKVKYIKAFSAMRKSINDMFKARVIESVLPQDNRLRQFVYIIENVDNGAIKVGVGGNPDKRLKQLQTGSVSELELVYQSYICSNAFEIESIIHKEFSDYHIRGEWFDVDKNIVIDFIEQQNFVLNSEFMKYISLVR